MTYQEFNHIYYSYTKSKRGIRPMDQITTNGYELKEFLEFALKKIEINTNQIDLDFHISL